jgi:hypothetical protein
VSCIVKGFKESHDSGRLLVYLVVGKAASTCTVSLTCRVCISSNAQHIFSVIQFVLQIANQLNTFYFLENGHFCEILKKSFLKLEMVSPYKH